MFIRNRIIAGGAVALVTVTLGGVSLALADNPVSTRTVSGQMTYYNDSGYGACGSVVDAATEDLVAVSHEWWTSADPNQDRLCRGVDVQVTYNGKTITVPVKDMCPSCDAGHLDLSQTAFRKLAPLEKGLVKGISWKFVTDGGEAIEPPSTSPEPEGSGVPASGASGGSGWPSRYAAPYMETWGSPSELEKARQAGLRYATLAFVLDGGGCKATFNGNTPVTDQGWKAAVQNLRSSGGDAMASFGGASGTELGQACDSVPALQEQYRAVVDALDLSRLDFDIEGAALADSAANHRRDQALAALQQQSEAAGHRLDVQFTLPSGAHGLEAGGVAMLRDAQSTGLRVSLVNIMTMDYGSAVDDMGQAAIDAATGLHDQLGQIWTSKTPEELWAMEGNTPMIGVNDTPGEVFTTEDAERLAKFAVDKGIQQLSFWAVGRDKACPEAGKLSESCSGTEQSDHQFLKTFDTVTTTSPGTSPEPTRSAIPVPTRSGTPAPSASTTPGVPDSGSRGGSAATTGSTASKGTGGSGQTIDTAFTTGYTWFDNTPRGSARISDPILHQQAGGTGTYDDPITLAVGHSMEGGKDTLDYPAGTRFYMPRVRRYFIVEDACGDGGSPQNGPCHSLKTAPQGATTWLDMYVGGESGDSESAVQACADKVTAGAHGGLNTVVRDPGPGLPVVEGPVFQNGRCTELY
ncbi:cysteine/serine endopeptidase inhibitor [Streptomyces sp. AGS-58]|uniref:cysteine/serine endopeptidase inhibitor n=1 Tax=unclassified Streptomyces TaxID=2593676 RepID=UPI0035A280B6